MLIKIFTELPKFITSLSHETSLMETEDISQTIFDADLLIGAIASVLELNSDVSHAPVV